MLLDDEQVELLQDLPVVLEERNAELDAVQKALKDVQAENAQFEQRLDRLESKPLAKGQPDPTQMHPESVPSGDEYPDRGSPSG